MAVENERPRAEPIRPREGNKQHLEANPGTLSALTENLERPERGATAGPSGRSQPRLERGR